MEDIHFLNLEHLPNKQGTSRTLGRRKSASESHFLHSPSTLIVRAECRHSIAGLQGPSKHGSLAHTSSSHTQEVPSEGYLKTTPNFTHFSCVVPPKWPPYGISSDLWLCQLQPTYQGSPITVHSRTTCPHPMTPIPDP